MKRDYQFLRVMAIVILVIILCIITIISQGCAMPNDSILDRHEENGTWYGVTGKYALTLHLNETGNPAHGYEGNVSTTATLFIAGDPWLNNGYTYNMTGTKEIPTLGVGESVKIIFKLESEDTWLVGGGNRQMPDLYLQLTYTYNQGISGFLRYKKTPDNRLTAEYESLQITMVKVND